MSEATRLLNNTGKLWNHIPNEYTLTKKHFLAMNLQSYIEANKSTISPEFHAIHPTTYTLENPKEKEAFLEVLERSEIRSSQHGITNTQLTDIVDHDTLWIMKPVNASGGKGIQVIDSLEKYKKVLESGLDSPHMHFTSYIAQRYLAKPLLLNSYKFDIRAYMYIADVNLPLAFYHRGYLRVNIEPYDTSDLSNIWSHISNIGLQKLHPEYEAKKLNSKWSFKTWQKYMLEKQLVTDPKWIENTIEPQLRQIMTICYRSVETKLKMFGAYGCFALLGVDFLIDSNMKAWILECTKTPAGHATLEKDDNLFTEMMDELLAIQMELSEKKRVQGASETTDIVLESVKDFVRIV